jgi:hypothetical protein
MEKEEWKPFRNALDKSDRKEFDEMWDLPKFYISACSNSVQYVRLHPILMSILLYHYKQLTECISEVERIEGRESTAGKKWLKKKEKVRVFLGLPPFLSPHFALFQLLHHPLSPEVTFF